MFYIVKHGNIYAKKRQVVLYGEINQVIREFIKKSIDALKRKVAIATFDTTCLLRITNYELRITNYDLRFRIPAKPSIKPKAPSAAGAETSLTLEFILASMFALSYEML